MDLDQLAACLIINSCLLTTSLQTRDLDLHHRILDLYTVMLLQQSRFVQGDQCAKLAVVVPQKESSVLVADHRVDSAHADVCYSDVAFVAPTQLDLIMMTEVNNMHN